MKVFLFTVGLLSLILSNTIRAAEPLLFVTAEWAPYNFTRDGELTGFSTEIIQAMMAELGESHEIRVYPGARTTKVLDAQPNAVGFSYFRTPKRDNKYKWVGALVDEVIYLYKRKEDDRSFSSLEDARLVEGIVVSNKGIIQAKLEALGFDNYTKFTNNKDQIKHVLQGRSDLLANFTPLGLAYYLRSMGEPLDSLVPTGVKLVEFSLSIAFSKEIPDPVIRRWQGALDAVRKSGVYERIYQKYQN